MDFGTIGMSEKREAFFALVNPGPVKVVLRGWGGNITGKDPSSLLRSRAGEPEPGVFGSLEPEPVKIINYK